MVLELGTARSMNVSFVKAPASEEVVNGAAHVFNPLVPRHLALLEIRICPGPYPHSGLTLHPTSGIVLPSLWPQDKGSRHDDLIIEGWMKPILVVDDEPQIRSYLKKLLLREGFEILAVHNGASAIGMIREIGGNIAALVTDIEMRDMDGIVLAKTVTGEFPDIPILFITALPISEIDLRLSVPRCVLLQKPFDSKDFVQSLRNLLMRPEEASSSIAH